jgi:tetratricopeptide (TPR) repeat protein
MKTGRYDESITYYQKALEVDRTFAASHIGIATNLNFMDRHEQARDQLQKMYGMALDDGQRRQAIFATAVSYVDEGMMQEALAELDKMHTIAEKINDYAAMAGDLTAMGNILREDGKPIEALAKYKTALTQIENSNLSPDVKQTARRNFVYNEARVALSRGDVNTAKVKSEEYLTQVKMLNNPNEVRLAHELKGMIAIENKDFKTAHASLLKANQQNPDNLYLIAVAYQGQGDKKKAKEMCETAAGFNALNSMNQAFAKHKAKRMLAGM